ncbi:unnamed protein product, partial [Pylaiella littoralis]
LLFRNVVHTVRASCRTCNLIHYCLLRSFRVTNLKIERKPCIDCTCLRRGNSSALISNSIFQIRSADLNGWFGRTRTCGGNVEVHSVGALASSKKENGLLLV